MGPDTVFPDLLAKTKLPNSLNSEFIARGEVRGIYAVAVLAVI